MDEYDIESILDMYEDDYVKVADIKMSNKIPLLDRDNFNTSDLEQSPDSFLRPGETLEDFDVTFRRPNAQGGVIGKPGGLVKENIGYYGKKIELTKEQKKLFNQYKKFFPNAKDSAVSIKVRNNQITEDTITKLKKGISLKTTDKDKKVLDADTIKKIKEKIKLKPGQKWNFYNPETNPTGYTYGIPKKNPKYDIARNLKPGRAEKKLKQSKEYYEKIKADPELLAQKKAYDRERFLRIRDIKNEQANLKYSTDKDFREKKLEWARQDRIKNPEKYKQKLNDYFAKKGRFPPGNNYKENVWRDMFRSSQKSGQERFLLVDENGSLLTEDKFPKKDGKVRWDVDGAYKKVKFYDTVTEQFVKFSDSIPGEGINFEKYLDQKSVGGKGAYQNAINGYKNKDDIKNLSFKDSKGKTIRLGTIVQEKLNDGVNFINSGVNVQHPDINNAFWKNEVTLASANNQLNYLEMTLERELRNAGNDVTKRNKAINNFKSEINKQPGGITKIVEGKTFGIEPTKESIVKAIGKEFKLDRFKNFPKTNKQIKNLLKNFEAHPGGCGKAAGGRILFAEGTPDGKITKCARRGVQAFIDDLKKGNYSKATMDLLKGGGNVLKNIVNPMELIKLRNLIGPAAMGFMGLFEAGVITDDVIRQGTPLNESLANNWLTKSFLPYTKQYAQAKNLLETGKVPSNMKKYVEDVVKFNEALKEIQNIEGNIESRLVDQGGYGMIDGSSMYSQEQQEKDEADVMKKLSSITDYNFMSGSAKDLEYKKMLDEMEATRMAKKGFSPFFGFSKLKDVRTKDPTGILDYMDVPDPKEADLRPITYMDAEYEDLKKLPTAERKMYEDYFTEQGFLKPRQSLSELKFGDSNVYDEVLKDYNKFQRQKEASKYPGYYGTQYSEGGIASLNVNKK